jgi:secondary thiamine-phosphate synthase enzyme
MTAMRITSATITQNTGGFCDIIDITGKLTQIIADQNIADGVATLWVSGSTAALTTIEYETGLVQDMKALMEKLVPSRQSYHHDERWGDNNGFSHLRASLFGPSLSIPVAGGKPLLAAWQQVVLLDFDNRARTREIIVQLIGEINQSVEKL